MREDIEVSFRLFSQSEVKRAISGILPLTASVSDRIAVALHRMVSGADSVVNAIRESEVDAVEVSQLDESHWLADGTVLKVANLAEAHRDVKEKAAALARSMAVTRRLQDAVNYDRVAASMANPVVIVSDERLMNTVGVLSTEESMVVSMGVSVEVLNRLIQDNQVLAAPVSGGRWAFPLWQLDGMDVNSELLSVFQTLISSTGRWDALAWMCTPHGNLGGFTPLHWIGNELPVESVLTLARTQPPETRRGPQRDVSWAATGRG